MAVESLSAAVYGAETAGASMFSSLLPIVGIGMTAFNILTSWNSYREQKKQQQQLAQAQIKQSNLLREKIKADSADLFSSVKSSVAQTSGAMGAVY